MDRINGLILTGGRSRRMGQDKANLRYHGISQLEHAWRLLSPRVAQCYVSLRNDQQAEPERSAYPQIIDLPDLEGPLAGIISALQSDHGAAWLVLACDLPRLDGPTLDCLLSARDPSRLATAFRSSHDGLPEPLCAIYEPRSRDALQRFRADGGSCPRKFLGAADVALLQLPDARALDNVNNPQEYRTMHNELSGAARPGAIALTVEYYALLREQAGRSREQLQTPARTPRELYRQLRSMRGLSLPEDVLRVAVNDEFADWDQPLQAGDSLVFIPPVAGG
ncbi:MAG: NTP transferase domain-containing protein [Steroidobacteraceae bacterium]